MHFYKYQGTGNDFVMIDDRNNNFDITDTKLVKHFCDRRFGIGADGLILLRLDDGCDFEMVYFNSDGNLSSMCGNGGRCIARFAQFLKIIENKGTFKAIDGMHNVVLDHKNVALKMGDVEWIEQFDDSYFLNTGSPHIIKYVMDIDALHIIEEAHRIRYNERFRADGTNVNFVLPQQNSLKIRTYERGVEDETLSCGTGITAAALADALHNKKPEANYATNMEAMGGNLKVTFDYDGKQKFTNVYLIGAAEFIFEGDI